MHLGVIASMKSGLEPFIYREMSDLARQGRRSAFFRPKIGRASTTRVPSGTFHAWNVWWVILSQPWRFLAMPVRYVAMLLQGIRYGGAD